MLCGGTGNELDVVCNLSTRETEPQNETVSKSQSCEEGRSQCRLGLTGV